MRPRTKGALIAASLLCAVFLMSGVASADSLIPNDPGWSTNQGALYSLGVPAAWGLTQGSPAVTIAVVDSGVAPDPDLVPNLVPGYNTFDGSSNATDDHGHGTAMAGIAAAVLNNGIGVPGICGKCRVMPVKVFDSNDRGSTSTMAAGLQWAAAHHAQIINFSGGPDPGVYDAGLINACTSAVSQGSVVVLASGNQGSSDPNSNTLASNCPGAIRVANYLYFRHDLDGNRGSWVDIAGVGSIAGLGPDRGAGATSAAAASVSGIAGLVLSCNPTLTPAQVKSILMSTVTPAQIDVISRGEVNAYQAVQAAGCKAAPEMLNLKISIKGKGTVSRQPNKASYEAGSTVALTAKAKPHWRFASWLGLCHGKQKVCRLTLTASGTATAVFKRR